MRISYIALDRIVERKAAEDEAYRAVLKRNFKTTLSDARALPDDELLEKLRSLGIHIDRDRLDKLTDAFPSAQELSNKLVEELGPRIREEETDWVWFGFTCLWERWFPERPNFEMLDDRMQAGYEALEKRDSVEAARMWLQVWWDVQHLMSKFKIETLEFFDEWFAGTNSVFNWVQTFSMELHNAGLSNAEFHKERLELCRRMLELAPKSTRDQKLVGYFKQELADSHAQLGDYETVDQLYTEWLEENPQWGWGWIGWSDTYSLSRPTGARDPERVEQILKQGLDIPEVDDQEFLIERLESLYQKAGRDEALHELRERFDPDVQATREWSLDQVIAKLDQENDSALPQQAIRAAQQRRQEITPRLIELIRKATEEVAAGGPVSGQGHFYAFFLLAEFRAREALPAILEAISLPDEGPFDLFGDAITENLAAVLAALVESPEQLDALISNRSIDEYVRTQAANAYLYFVRDGRLTREEAVERLRGHLKAAIAEEDFEITSELVYELEHYSPQEALDEIRQAFDRELVDPIVIDRDEVEESIAEGESRFAESLRLCRPTGIEDTVEELQSWVYEDEDWDEYDDEWDDDVQSHAETLEAFDDAFDDEQEPVVSATIYNTTPRVGRNEPCPCGSGKKYKKCCGRS